MHHLCGSHTFPRRKGALPEILLLDMEGNGLTQSADQLRDSGWSQPEADVDEIQGIIMLSPKQIGGFVGFMAGVFIGLT